MFIASVRQFGYLYEDLKRWKVKTFREFFYFIFELGVWATILYRISRALYLLDIPVIKIVFRLIGFFINKLSEIIFGVALSSDTEIGPGLYIGHAGDVRFHPDVKIGKDFNIGSGVTIGVRGDGYSGAPTIGDNVYIHTGAKVLGSINIGNNVKVGANAVVIRDIPNDATVVGVPARIVKIGNREMAVTKEKNV